MKIQNGKQPIFSIFFAIGGIACLLLLCMRCTPMSFLRNFETNLICECQLRTEQTWQKFYKLREEFKITRLINFGVCGLILCFPKRLGNGRGKEGIVAVPSTLFTNRVITSDNSSVNEKAHGARKSEVVSWKSDPEQVMKFWNSWNFLGCTVMDKRQSTDRHCYPDFTRIILSNISSRSNVPWKGPAIL